jgi:hypothetical protein
MALLAVWRGWTVLQYLSYNVTFVQHQGRYLFPALGSISFAAALGLRELLRPRTARAVVLLLVLAFGLLLFAGALKGNMPVWPLVLLLAGGMWMAAAAWLPARWQWVVPSALYFGLLALDVTCLVAFILPALAV